MIAPRRRLRRRDEAGYAALLAALVISTCFLALAAIGVDTARWYVEAERVQKAADAAALAGVVYMPADLDKARTAAIAAAEKNGFPNSGTSSVTVAQGSLPSELEVTVTSKIANAFAAGMGVGTSTLGRSATADYSAPAPMGSPCNTFGNEPASNASAAQPTGSVLPSPLDYPNCSSNPQFWGAIAGPTTDKVSGDRYMSTSCASTSTYRCVSSGNSETKSEGYFYAIHIEPEAVGQTISIQLYDPAFIETGTTCGDLTAGAATNGVNSYAPDGATRYAASGNSFCTGDYGYGSAISAAAPDTTFVLREQTTTGDPLKAAVVSTACTKQYRGIQATPSQNGTAASGQNPAIPALSQWTNAQKTTTRALYNPEVARLFHQWVDFCSFTAARSGDYYLQVRTNRTLTGTPKANTNANGNSYPSMEYPGDANVGLKAGDRTTGNGLNAFAIRAFPATTSLRNKVAVAGFSRMPIYQNATGSTASFNLIRALPGTKGQYIAFDFFDAADAANSGTVKVIPPTDSTWSGKSGANVTGCSTAFNDATTYTSKPSCVVDVASGTNNGQVQHLVIPIPPTYSCNATKLAGCWFQVEISFGSGTVSDFTTWDANIGGDPVRLVE